VSIRVHLWLNGSEGNRKIATSGGLDICDAEQSEWRQDNHLLSFKKQEMWIDEIQRLRANLKCSERFKVNESEERNLLETWEVSGQ
jgi:hypothetical protein